MAFNKGVSDKFVKTNNPYILHSCPIVYRKCYTISRIRLILFTKIDSIKFSAKIGPINLLTTRIHMHEPKSCVV